MKHADLIDRLNAGSGPDLAVDGEITYLFYGDTGMVPLSPYTTSLDACIGLMREVLPGWRRAVDEIDPLGPFEVTLYDGESVIDGEHKDECRALLIAILQAVDTRNES